MHSLGSAAPHLPLEGDLPADHGHLRHLRTQCRYLHYISRYIYTRYLCISTVCTRVTPPPRQVPASPCVCSMAVSGWAWWQRRPWPGSRRNTWVVCHHYTVHCTLSTLHHALQDVMLPPGARYHEAAPVLATAAEPDLGHEDKPRLCAAVCLLVIITILQTIECCQHRVAGQRMVHQRLG